jgi:hypothetical protein
MTAALSHAGHDDAPIGRVLTRSLEIVRRGQMATGEVAGYYRRSDSLAYLRSVLPSVFVHEALAFFDPTSPSVDTTVFDAILKQDRLRFLHTITRTRAKIRGYLCWDESSDGNWRFFGRAGGIPADADATASAATALLDARRTSTVPRWQRHVEALRKLPASEDLATEANVIRFFAMVGEPIADRLGLLLEAIDAGLLHPKKQANGWMPLYCVVRAWSSAHLPERERVRQKLLPIVLEGSRDGFGGALSTALGLSLLIDLEHAGPEIDGTRARLLALRSETGVFSYEPFLPHAGGAAACSTAMAMAALARATIHRGLWT